MFGNGITENILMALEVYNSKNKKLNFLNEEKDFSEFEKYLGIISNDLDKLLEVLSKFAEIKKSSIVKKLTKNSEEIKKFPELMKNDKYNYSDPNNKINKSINDVMTSLLMNLISLEGTFASMSGWCNSLIKIFGGEDKYDELMQEMYFHKSGNISFILSEGLNSPETYPEGSIIKFMSLIEKAKSKDDYKHPVIEKYNSDKNLQSQIDKLLDAYKKIYDATSKNAGNYSTLEKEINNRFKSVFSAKSLGQQLKAVWNGLKSLLSDPIKSSSGNYVISGDDLLGTSLQNFDGPLLLLGPDQIIYLHSQIVDIVEKIKKPVGIFRDQLMFGGSDEERIDAMVDNGQKAFPYLKDKEKSIEKDDLNPLAAAMISQNYFGENIHKRKLSDLLFEDAEEFVNFYNMEKSPVRAAISKKAKSNIDVIFPKLSGKFVGSEEPAEIEIEPGVEDLDVVDVEDLEKEIEENPDEALEVIAKIKNSNQNKIEVDVTEPEKIVIKPANSTEKEQEQEVKYTETPEFTEWMDSIFKDEEEKDAIKSATEKTVNKINSSYFRKNRNILSEDAKTELYKNLSDEVGKNKAKEMMQSITSNGKDVYSEMGIDLEGDLEIEDPPYSKEDWIEILRNSHEEEGFSEKLIDPLAEVLADDDFKDIEKTKKNLENSGLPFEIVVVDDEPSISYNKEIVNSKKSQTLNRKALQDVISKNIKGYDGEDRKLRNRFEIGLIGALKDLGVSNIKESFSLKKTLLMEEVMELEFDDLEEKYRDNLKRHVNEDELEEAVEFLQKKFSGLSGHRFLKSLEKFGFKILKKSQASDYKTGITINSNRWQKAKDQFYKKAAANNVKYTKGLTGKTAAIRYSLKNKEQLQSTMKAINSVAMDTSGLKAPIFPEGKRRPRSKLIHKKSLIEAIFRDDD